MDEVKMDEVKRYCEPFSMSAQEFYNFKKAQTSRWVIYILAMLLCTILTERYVAWGHLTFLFFIIRYNDAQCIKQWIKDGSITRSDLW